MSEDTKTFCNQLQFAARAFLHAQLHYGQIDIQNYHQMYVTSSVPPLALRSAKTPRSKSAARQFYGWDSALEKMLATPITPDLVSSVTWKQESVFNADPRIDTSTLGTRARTPCSSGPQFRAKDREMRTRQLKIAKTVTAPLSPRKRSHETKCLSIRPDTTTRHKFRDSRQVETVMHGIQKRMCGADSLTPMRKPEMMAVARNFGITVSPALRGALGPGRQRF